MIHLRRAALAVALALAFGPLAGCGDEDDQHASRVAREALGVRATKSTTETKPRKVIVRTTEEVIDAATKEILSEKVTETPVTVQVEVEREIKTNVGETRTATTEE